MQRDECTHLDDVSLIGVHSGDHSTEATGDLHGGFVALHLAHAIKGTDDISLLQEKESKDGE